jgi:hypothetical protein
VELVIVQVLALEPEIAPVAEQALAIVLVAVELEVVLAALERGIAPAVEELALVPVVAALGLDLVVAEPALVQVAVLVGTKSVTATHHRGLPLLTVVDSVAVAAETLHEPAVTEAVTAWGAEGLAAAAAAGVEAAADAAAVGDEKGR